MKNIKRENGITLIALVITIIVMLILVLVTINIAMDGGLFTNAKKAARDYQIAQISEQIVIAKANAYDLEMQEKFINAVGRSNISNPEQLATLLNLKKMKAELSEAFEKEIKEGKITIQIDTYISKAMAGVDTSSATPQELELLNRLNDIDACITLLEDISKLSDYYHNESNRNKSVDVILSEIASILSSNTMVMPTEEDINEWKNPSNSNILEQIVNALANEHVFLMIIAIANIGTSELTVTYTEPGYDAVEFVVYANGTDGIRTQDQLDWLYDENNGQLTLIAYTGSKTNITVPTEIDGKPVVAIDKYVLTKGEESYTSALKDIDLYGDGTLYTLTKSNYQEFIPALAGLGLDVSTDMTFDELATLINLTEKDGIYYVTTTSSGQFIKTLMDVNLTIPAGIEVKQYAFYGAQLKSLSLAEGVVIGRDAFYRTALKEVTIPRNANVGGYAFAYSAVEKVDIKDGVVMGSAPFEECENLKVVRIGNMSESKATGFYEDYYVEKLILCEGLILQPWGIYSDKLEEVYLPASIVSYFVEKYNDPDYLNNDIYMHYEHGDNPCTTTVYAVVPSSWTSANIETNKATAEHLADEMTYSTITFVWSDEPGYKSPTF